MVEENHPNEGDTLVLTDIVHDKVVIGTGLPTGYKMAHTDQTFDRYPVKVKEIKTFHRRGDSDRDISRETLILEKPNGETTRAQYKGREPIAGTEGSPIRVSNSQRSSQGYVWEKKE